MIEYNNKQLPFIYNKKNRIRIIQKITYLRQSQIIQQKQMNKQSGQLLNFLKKENQMLKDDMRQMRQILRLNKQALQVSLNYKGEDNYEKSIPQLIKLLYEQNSLLRARIQQLQNQIETGLCKALISDQIAFASTQQQVLVTNELKEKLVKMRRQLQLREKRIVELTKVAVDEKTGIQQHINNQLLDGVRLVEYCDMNKVTKRLKDQIEKLNQQLDQKKEQFERMRDGKEELFKLNLILTKQLNELKLLTSCQTTKSNNNHQLSLQCSNNDMTRYMKYQKKLVNEEENIYEDDGRESAQSGSDSQSSGDSDSHEESEIESSDEEEDVCVEIQNDEGDMGRKVNQSMQAITAPMKFASSTVNDKSLANLTQKSKMNITLNLNNLSLKKKNSLSSKMQQTKPKMNIPKLQLTKAKQIQNLIVKKINNDQKKKKESSINAPIKQEKYKKLEDELDNLRKKLGHQILQKLALERQCNVLKKIIAELEQRNALFVERTIKEQEEESYQKKRRIDLNDNFETLIDICRDVTMNQRLRRVVLGKEILPKKQVECLQV